MAKELVPGLVALYQCEGAALSIESNGFEVHCHYYQDIFNFIEKNIKINNKFKKWWQTWQPLAKSRCWLMGFTFNFLGAVVRPPKYGVLYV